MKELWDQLFVWWMFFVFFSLLTKRKRQKLSPPCDKEDFDVFAFYLYIFSIDIIDITFLTAYSQPHTLTRPSDSSLNLLRGNMAVSSVLAHYSENFRISGIVPAMRWNLHWAAV